MIPATSIILIAGSVMLAAFFAGSENGLYALNRWRLRHRREGGWPSARLLGALLDSPRSTVTAMLIGTNISYYVLSATVTGLVAGAAPEGWRLGGVVPVNPEIASALLLMLPAFIMCEVIPKNLFRHRAETILYRVAIPLYFWVKLILPLSAALAKLSTLSEHLTGSGTLRRRYELTRRRLLALMAEGAQSGTLSGSQVSIGSHVMRLGEMQVSQAMVPIGNAVVLDESSPVSEFLLAAKMKGLWRVLVRSNEGRITGMASLYEAIPADPDSPLSGILREVMPVPSDMSVGRALVRMQRARQVLAVVEDPAGDVAGQVSMNDLVGTITSKVS